MVELVAYVILALLAVPVVLAIGTGLMIAFMFPVGVVLALVAGFKKSE